MVEPELEAGHVLVSGTVDIGEDRSLHEVLNQLKKLDAPEVLKHQFVGLGADDPEQMHVAFSDREQNNVYFGGGETETELIASIVLDGDHRDLLPTLLTKALDVAGPLEISESHASFHIDMSFEELDLPAADAGDYVIVGVRIEFEDGEFIVQEDDDGTALQLIPSAPEVLEGPVSASFLEKIDKRAEDLIRKVT
jgi:hypothetical protein